MAMLPVNSMLKAQEVEQGRHMSPREVSFAGVEQFIAGNLFNTLGNKNQYFACWNMPE
jgi:hypothetical protein